MEVSRSGYYRSLSVDKKKECEQDSIVSMVNEIRRTQPQCGGKKLFKMLHEPLQDKEIYIGRDKFFHILRTNGLLIRRKRRYVSTTQSKHRFKVYRNELKKTPVTAPNQAVVSDITYLRVRDGFMYLSLQTDVFSRKITGWDLSKSLGIESSLKALKRTLRQSPDPKGLIHHSDRGIQYCSNTYTSVLKRNRMVISMTEENHCYENAIAERVNGILKQEFLLDVVFPNEHVLRRAVRQAIHTYNHHRPHWSLQLRTPEQCHTALEQPKWAENRKSN